MVTFVMRLVKELRPPSTFPEKDCTPPTTDAARSAPGSADEPRPTDGIEVAVGVAGWPKPPVEMGRYVGS